MSGFAGKILRVDLTSRTLERIDTERYRRFGGGHGMGAALFWDLCPDKTIQDGRRPENVCSIMASPLCGTNVPSAGGRCEVTGAGVGPYPVGWFTRTNFGGHFSSMLKQAGWDGIVLTGRADSPVWLDVRNDHVALRDARDLWGKDTWTTQQRIRERVLSGADAFDGWWAVPEAERAALTTQPPSVLAIGPAGENQTAHGCLVHGAGNGAGQGGFGAVWGSKNLKAISVVGTGTVDVADPAALLRARFTAKEKYAADPDDPDLGTWGTLNRVPNSRPFVAPPTDERRTSACFGCVSGCKARYSVGYGNESLCQTSNWYAPFAAKVAKGDKMMVSEIVLRSADVIQQYGANSYTLQRGLEWLEYLYHRGVLGPGRRIHSELPWEELGTLEFARRFIHALATRQDIGADLADGWVQAAIRWGREDDWHQGRLPFPYWGYGEHAYDPRAELEWGYATLVTERDINDHAVNIIFWDVNIALAYGRTPRIDAATMARLVGEKMAHYLEGDPSGLDYGDANMYSESVARLVRWILHYNRFWKNSALFCDLRWPSLYDTQVDTLEGATASPDAGEQVFWNAVTGEDITFEEGLERGRAILNLNQAIWTLQGRHRDMVRFARFIYEKPYDRFEVYFPFYNWPTRDENGAWAYRSVLNRRLSEEGVERWKTHFYRLEGWDPRTGWPTRSTLESLGLAHVADELERAGRLGREEA